jgi:hypothetical protein
MQNWNEELPIYTTFTSLLKQIKLKMNTILSKTNYTRVTLFEIWRGVMNTFGLLLSPPSPSIPFLSFLYY